MKLSTPMNRSLLLWAVFCVLLTHVVWTWISLRFVLNQASYRVLDPEHYKVRIVTPEDYRRLADPKNYDVTLSDGSRIQDRTPAWFTHVLPKFKETDDGRFYVLVTTKGTAHVLSYVEGPLLILGFFSACGVAASFWNLCRVGTEQARVVPQQSTRSP